MVSDQAMIAIGIGCRKGAARDAIAALVRRARVLASAECGDACLFSHERKREEKGLVAAAEALNLPLSFLPHHVLQAVSHQTATLSQHSWEATGISSVSEAAALAGAGSGARLLLGRISGDGVTCAIAVGNKK
jgi:cobalt-precorrin 5A hydrolase